MHDAKERFTMDPEVDTQPQEQDTGTVTPETGSEDEAIALFNQRAQSKAAESQETPTDEPEEESDSGNPEEDDPAEDDPQEELVEVEYEGAKYSLPKALKDAVLRKADYSRHVQEVTAQKKDYAQRIERTERMIEGAGKYAEHLAKVQALESQIEQFKEYDFDKLETEDPARASILAFRLLRLQQARDKAIGEAQGVSQRLAQERSENLKAQRGEMLKTLEKDLPGWGEELGVKVSQYALRAGYSETELQSLTDARMVILLDKARKFDAIQDGKAAAVGKVREAPRQVLKPGAPRRVDKSAEAHAKFQRDRSEEAAIELLHARAAARR